MTPQQLRNSILQMAIEGKLTEQRAEDGNASELLKEIKAEKARLIAEKKIKKEKSLPEISEDEIPFEIPDNWVWCRIGEIFYLQAGKNISASAIYDKGAYPCYGGNGLRGYVSTYNREGHYPLIGRQGALCGNINFADGKFYATEHAVVVETYKMSDSDWAGIFLKTLNLNQYATATAQPGLAVSKINIVLIPLPPFAEQKRIVARLEEILLLVDEYEKAYNELQELNKKFPDNLKNSLLQMAIEGKLVEQRAEDGNARDLLKEIQAEKAKLIAEKKIKKEKPLPEINEDEIPFEIPDNWVWCRLDDIVSKEIRRGKSPKYDEAGSAFAFAQKCNSKYDGIRLDLARKISDESLKRYGDDELLQDKDIIINSTGNGTLGRIGMYKEIYNTNNDKYFADSHVTVVRIQKNILSEYIHIALLSYHKYLTSLGEGSTNQTELKPLIIKSLLIPIPPLAEQKRIVAKLEQILPLCDELSKEYK
jgi:type I restriction enzyme S subunit